MKCYRMHEALWITSTVSGHHPIEEALTVYHGYAVCEEHLEELVSEESRPSVGKLLGSAMREGLLRWPR